jgi:Domain of unknown function(DUF2779)
MRHAEQGDEVAALGEAAAIDQPATLTALKASWPMARYLPPPRTEADWQAAAMQTQAWLASGFLQEGEDRAIFGACLASNDGARARIDVLSPGAMGLRIGRVRLATAGDDGDVDRIAWWTHVAARAGVRIQGMVLMLIEQDFIYPGHGCLAGVFREVDVSLILGSRDVPGWMVGMRQTERGAEPPLPATLPCISPGEHEAPCPHLAHCGLSHRVHDGLAPDALEVMGRELADVLRAMGHRSLDTVSPELLPDARRLRAWRAIRCGQPVIEPAVASLIRALPRPWHLLRLDTIGHALPIWAGTRPYQMVPFHWACDLLPGPEALDTEPTHLYHLAQGTGDPRRAFALSLLQALGSQGAVIAYNAGFERNRLRELARFAPDLAPRLEAIQARIVDLFQVMRAHAYHPAQRGSWSFKSVCRALAPELQIGRFSAAHATPAEAYAHSMQDRLSPAEVEAVREALQAHGQKEVAALRQMLRVLVHAERPPDIVYAPGSRPP